MTTTEEMKINPVLNEQLIGHQSLNERNEAQNLNVYDYIDQWGNKRHILSGKTKLGSRIARINPINFGSLACYWTDSMPMGVKYMKGQDKMIINQSHHFSRGRAILNRRALSRMLASWGYIYDVRYWKGKSNENLHDTAIGQWCIREEIKGVKYDLMSGIEAIQILNDIIRAVRNGEDNAMYEFRCQVNNPSDSNEVIVMKETFNANGKLINRGFKQEYFKRWRFPKYNVDYLESLIEDLNSGNYYLDVYVPIIHDLFQFPIKCTDTHEKKYQMKMGEDGKRTDDEFKRAKTEYEEHYIRQLQY